ncbi:uncharacterized protein LOC144863217 [Branchiostoma floridae x Branchiostoma japonicum]
MVLTLHRDDGCVYNTSGRNLCRYSCDGYVYNVTRRGDPPAGADISVSSQWAVLSRDFAEFAVSSKSQDKSIDFNSLQFYMQTTAIPDEKYLASILMSSQFRDTLISAHLHRLAPFQGKDQLGVCRHGHETDMCGKGPRTFREKDVPLLLNVSRRFMFARKFDVQPEDPTRRAVLHWQRGLFYLELQRHHGVSDALLRALAQRACEHFLGDGHSQVCRWVGIYNYLALPAQAYTQRGTCFDRGHIKYFEVSTRQWETNRSHTVLPELEEAGATTVYLRLYAQATQEVEETGTCTLNQPNKGKGKETTFARLRFGCMTDLCAAPWVWANGQYDLSR